MREIWLLERRFKLFPTFAPMVLEAKGIHKSYGPLEILKGVNLSIPKGEILSIVGKSGAGKSTLLHILGTLDWADQGEMNIAGQPIKSLNANQLASDTDPAALRTREADRLGGRPWSEAEGPETQRVAAWTRRRGATQRVAGG